MNAPELLRARWAQMPSRERRLVVLGVSVVALALLWWLALAPALHTLRGAPEQHRQLDGQLQRMRQLQAQAQSLQQRPQTQLADAKRALALGGTWLYLQVAHGSGHRVGALALEHGQHVGHRAAEFSAVANQVQSAFGL